MVLVAMLVCLLTAADAFWDRKPPEDWTIEEVQSILEDSPWSRTLTARRDQLQIHLSSAMPMRQAESREKLFQKRSGAAASESDISFQEMLDEGKYIVLSVKVSDNQAFADSPLVDRMQKDSQMRTGKRAFKLVTYFPPSDTSPYVRLIFPRVEPEKSLDFVIVVPGALDTYQRVSFFAKELSYRGKLEY